MDGMGETYRAMLQAEMAGDKSYTSDLSFGADSFECIPSDLKDRIHSSVFDWREAESVYVFTKSENTIDIKVRFIGRHALFAVDNTNRDCPKPVFKRFQQEKTPPTLYNHGFENMDSVGAVYSRASSHIFGDWNACGKVMGMAPWIDHSWKGDRGKKMNATRITDRIMTGKLYSEKEGEAFRIDRSQLEGIPFFARNDPELFNSRTGATRKRYDFDDDGFMFAPEKDPETGEVRDDDVVRLPTKVALDAIALSSRIQEDTEEVIIDFIKHFKEKTGQTNLCLAGGVALNSVLNGRLCRELGFEKTFIPPYPGDDGIAVGCCAFGLYGNPNLNLETSSGKTPPVWPGPLSPYLGPSPVERDIMSAVSLASPWLDFEIIRQEKLRISRIVNELNVGGVVAVYQGRSEIGPRALGHRSILADPRKKALARYINEQTKKREGFRPFAPSVLAEEASEWFELGDSPSESVSPYMSVTVNVQDSKRKKIPAVTHIDGSSRLQTVTKEDDPFYYAIISRFFKLTKVPMVLNTSFNTLPGEPIVETPFDAIKSFLCSMGGIDLLVMGEYVIRRKTPDVKGLLEEGLSQTDEITRPAKRPIRTAPVVFESSFSVDPKKPEKGVEPQTMTRVKMPGRPMHDDTKNCWLDLVDEFEGELLSICDGTNSVNDMMKFFSTQPAEAELDDEFYDKYKNVFDQLTRRLVRLYEHTFISW